MTRIIFFYCLLETLRWTRTPIDGPSPAPRLDHTLCTVEIAKPTGTCDTQSVP